jgi:hypothetical protein
MRAKTPRRRDNLPYVDIISAAIGPTGAAGGVGSAGRSSIEMARFMGSYAGRLTDGSDRGRTRFRREPAEPVDEHEVLAVADAAFVKIVQPLCHRERRVAPPNAATHRLRERNEATFASPSRRALRERRSSTAGARTRITPLRCGWSSHRWRRAAKGGATLLR